MKYVGSQASPVNPTTEKYFYRKCGSSDIVKQSEMHPVGGWSAAETTRGVAGAISLSGDGYGSPEIPARNTVSVSFGDFPPFNILTYSSGQDSERFPNQSGSSSRQQLGQPTNCLGQSLEAVDHVTFNLQAPSTSNTSAAEVGEGLTFAS